MAIQVFTESEVRSAIIKKAPIVNQSGERSPHAFVSLVHKNIKLSHFRVPNDHRQKAFKQGKGNHMAKNLQLEQQEYNDFVHCRMKRDAYLKILDTKVAEIIVKDTGSTHSS